MSHNPSIIEKQSFLTMPLEEKVKRTKMLIMDWYAQFGGKVYVSFSGGKDSTVLLHIARSVHPDIVGVFDDTGLEYPEIREFVKKQDNIIWIKPKMNFKQVLDKYGYPIISKEQSYYIYQLRTTKSDTLKKLRLEGGYKGKFKISDKWKPLLDADFKISNFCCDVMKKRPFKVFEKETGFKPIVGVMADESRLRWQKYMLGDCNEINSKHPTSHPIMFWSEQDILKYIKDNNIEIAKVYGDVVEENGTYKTTGCNRTGCMFCMYGLHLESHPNRFERMKHTHPVQYDYIMNKLNGAHVINEYLKLDSKCAEPELFDDVI